MAYAAGTDVSLQRSVSDLEKLIRSKGFGGFVQGIADDRLVIAFSSAEGRQVRFIVAVREPDDELLLHMRKVIKASYGKLPTNAQEAWEQHRRQLGRALLLTVKAKIECIEAGIETFEDAFMSQLTLPDGRTVGTMVKGELKQLYSGGQTPPRLLPALREIERHPTPAMIAAAWDVVDKARRGSGITKLMPGLGVREIWEAMYDAALKDRQ